MKAGRKIGIVLGIFLVSSLFAFGSATNVYITQSGTATGNCTSNVQTPAFFNNSSNWGNGSSQIGPGTTVLLCGTFTFSAGATGFTVHGSGTSANPVVINFDSGAILQAPYFGGSIAGGVVGGAIVINGQSYITVNGQNTGIIQNTNNGSPSMTCLAGTGSGGKCGVAEPSVGVDVYGTTTGITVENLTIQDIYLNSPTSSDSNGQNTADIEEEGTNTNTVIQGNTLKHARLGYNLGNGGNTENGLIIADNIFNDHSWHLSIADGNGTGSMSGTVAIYGNTISNFADWNTAAYHQDGLIAYTASPETYTMYLYNNYFQGVAQNSGGCQSFTAFVSNGMNSPTPGADTMYVFNNVFDATSSLSGSCSSPGLNAIWTFPNATTYVYNNTIIGNEPTSGGAEITLQNDPGNTVLYAKNNIYMSAQTVVADYATSCCADIAASDYNDYYGLAGTQTFAFNVGEGSGPWYTLSTWQSTFADLDAHSTTANPVLNSSYVPQSGSGVIGKGVNLYSICNGQSNPGLGALCYDAAGNTRPASAAWDIGAYQDPSAPLPPSGLSAVVN